MTNQIISLEPTVDPNNRISFLVDWELTMKCNLDCAYCGNDLYGGHDNTASHPTLEACQRTIDFMFQYTDLYMTPKKRGIKYCILNIYGGEALHYPNIIPVLNRVKSGYQPYADKWHLIVTTTTNLIVTAKKLMGILPLVDEFTCSYHPANTVKQEKTFKDNLLAIKVANKRLKVIIMIDPRRGLWQKSLNMCKWCEQHDIKYLPKQIDNGPEKLNKIFFYTKNQINWLNEFYNTKNYNQTQDLIDIEQINEKTNFTDIGRACCGGRTLCINQNHSTRTFFVPNKFTGWFCSVNEFFVHIKQRTGEIFVNKDCKMNFDGQVGPIGHLAAYHVILESTQTRIKNRNLEPIRCAKSLCRCGLCAPKSEKLSDFKQMMQKFYS